VTATLQASADVLKLRYPEGKLPRLLYSRAKAKFVSLVEKREDWTGDNWIIAVQNENPQGSSADFATALGSLAQGNYKRFSIDRKEHFGIARIKGQALKAVEGNEGALVDLWRQESEGIATTELLNHEIYALGNGSGTLGQVASGQSTATITLSQPADAAKFALNMRVQAVSDNTLSPTLRSGTATITGINRITGTLTVATTWTGVIPSLTANDYLVRAGDYASSGTASVISGIFGWIGGTGTWFGLNTTTDPVRFRGQSVDCTGLPYGEALIEMSARVNQQGAPQPGLAIVHPRDLANFKKSVDAKRVYDAVLVESATAMVSFPGLRVDGDEGPIDIVTSPFIARNQVAMLYMDAWTLRSLKGAPHLQDYDSNEFLRVGGDDAYELRFASWPNLGCYMPFANAVGTNWGA
jgi:hypothetical protein